MVKFRVMAASLLLIGSQMASAEDAPAPGAAPYGPMPGYGYAPGPYGGAPHGGRPARRRV